MKTLRTIKETFFASLPLAIVMIVICVFVAPMNDAGDYLKLAIGYFSVVIGQSLFLTGLDKSILPIGKMVGSSLIKLKKSIFIIFFGLLFGLFATVAEPALAVLARQAGIIIGPVDATVFIWVTSAGVGIAVGFALYRIMKNYDIKIIFAILYGLVFLLVIFVPEEFVALAFDSSGATTGDVSVPFILVMGLGVSATMSKRKTTDDSFGIIGIASVGAIISVFIYGIIIKIANGGAVPPANAYDISTTATLMEVIVGNLKPVALTLLPIVALFIPFQFAFIKLPKKTLLRILLGTIPVYIGLLIFLSGIDYGFAFAGKYIGEIFFEASRPDWFKWLLLIVGFILGASITMSEPSVAVLGDQLEELTNGHIKKNTIRFTLAIGSGFAALLSMLKILTQINILYFLVPLYAIALLMMKKTPKLFVGLAYDSGGVTGGALTSAFLTPFSLGIAQAVAELAGPSAQSILTNGFGIIAFISVTPLIAVQVLGLIYDRRYKEVQEDLVLDEFSGLESFVSPDIENEENETDETDDADTENTDASNLPVEVTDGE